jgi:hypothetical protein
LHISWFTAAAHVLWQESSIARNNSENNSAPKIENIHDDSTTHVLAWCPALFTTEFSLIRSRCFAGRIHRSIDQRLVLKLATGMLLLFLSRSIGIEASFWAPFVRLTGAVLSGSHLAMYHQWLRSSRLLREKIATSFQLATRPV